jgi:hypothetical protein
MKSHWMDLLLVALSAVVGTLLAIWAWDSFKAWRINREYGPRNRRGPTRGRRHDD